MYDWSGSTILFTTITSAIRYFTVIDPATGNNMDIPVTADIRDFISGADSFHMKKAIEQMHDDYGLPCKREQGSFDERAKYCWLYFANRVDYRADQKSDYWQFPEETLARKFGDCEDLSLLLASLLLASGISPFCVRVSVGNVLVDGKDMGRHMWVQYKGEDGTWYILESTWNSNYLQSKFSGASVSKPAFTPADKLASGNYPTKGGGTIQYVPQFCFNKHHLWAIEPIAGPWDDTVIHSLDNTAGQAPEY